MRWLMSSVSLLLLVVVVVVEGGKGPKRQDMTPPTRCIPPNPCFPSRQVIAELAANLTGSVYQASDAEYPALVSSPNQRLTHHPAIVVVVATEADVQKAVLFTRKYHLMLTVASQNGDYTRGSFADGSLQINLSQMKAVNTQISVLTSGDLDPGTITTQAGATWPEVFAVAASVGRDVVGRDYFDQTVTEPAQAGGFGAISRSLGLIADNVVSARVVTMDGSVVEVSEAGSTLITPSGIRRFTTLDPGMWQAVRGGGAGNFGVVVSMTFQMHLPPAYVTQVTARYVLYENNQFVGRDPLKYLLPLVYSLPSQWGGFVFLSGFTSDTTVGQKGQVVVDLVHYGAYNSESYNAIEPLLNYNGNGARLAISVVNRTNVYNYDQSLQYQNLDNSRFYGFNTLLPPSALTDPETLDELVDTLLLILNDPAVDAQYLCSLQPLGGAISSINSTAYVTRSLREAAMVVECGLQWADSDAIRDEVFVGYSMDLARRIKDFGTGTIMDQGMFEDEFDWKHTLYGDNYRELLRVKIKYDVDNYLWCHNCVGSDYRIDCRHDCESYEASLQKLVDEMRSERRRKNRPVVNFMMHDHDDDDMKH